MQTYSAFIFYVVRKEATLEQITLQILRIDMLNIWETHDTNFCGGFKNVWRSQLSETLISKTHDESESKLKLLTDFQIIKYRTFRSAPISLSFNPSSINT